ncbi:MAG: DNA double-strand break repair nuclease NurA [Chloroflexi bacterium]|nr:DNA double-strand break repair nuclease NurA [Chloroflexota bacterium]
MGERPCDAIDGIRDRDIFAELLNEGERSGLFASTSKVVMKHYGSQHIYFFYVKLDEEIARIEVPQWVAFSKDKLELTHALVLDQARRGLGYPTALAEAHEQAVVKNTDKYTLEQMIEVALYKEVGTIQGSAKYRSKQTRRI